VIDATMAFDSYLLSRTYSLRASWRGPSYIATPGPSQWPCLRVEPPHSFAEQIALPCFGSRD
jgi:hypothetical protein